MKSESDKAEFDNLAEHLRDQAMAERPAFSAEIHDRVMRGIQSGSEAERFRWSGLMATAAAIALLSTMISLRWLVPGRHQKIALKAVSNPVTPPPPVAHLPDEPIQLTVEVGGLFSLKISPLQVSLSSPISSSDTDSVEQPPATVPVEPIGSPEWLLTRMEEPASLAQATIADLIPPDMQRLMKQAPTNQ